MIAETENRIHGLEAVVRSRLLQASRRADMPAAVAKGLRQLAAELERDFELGREANNAVVLGQQVTSELTPG